MKHIKILGTGCTKCTQFAENTKAAAEELGIEYELEKITELATIVSMGVMMTPGLVIDGEVKSTGKLLSTEDIKKILTAP